MYEYRSVVEPNVTNVYFLPIILNRNLYNSC